MNNLYEILEECLRDIQDGENIETVLFRYPEAAAELRPILEASINAKGMAVPAPAPDMVQRNRAKLLQRAGAMREAQVHPVSRRTWFASLRRVIVVFVVLAIVFASGTGLVRAASTTLPGDNLYPVKRTWEDVLLLFTFNLQQREALEIEHENERLDELNELFAEGRSAKVDFAGLVTSQNGDQWLVAGFPVVISIQTEMPDQPVVVGSAVRATGVTRGDGIVSAERIKLLPPGAKLPDVENEDEMETEYNEGPDQQIEDNSGKASGEDSLKVEEIKAPEVNDSKSGNGTESGSDDTSRNSVSGGEDGSHDSGKNSGSEDSSSGLGGGGED